MNVYLKELCKKAKINEPVKTIRNKESERIETISPKFNFIGTHIAGIIDGAVFSKDEKWILSWSEDKTIRLWNIRVDLDIPPSLYALQVKVFSGAEMDMDRKELIVLDPVIREQMRQEYEKKASEHYKVCKYPEANVWRRYHLEEAEKVRSLR